MKEYGEFWNFTESGKPKYSEKNLSHCHFSTTYPTWNGLGLNLTLRSERMATNGLSHGTAFGSVNL
jgi:hypothetical protein